MTAISIPPLHRENTQISAGSSEQVGPKDRRSRFFQRYVPTALPGHGTCLHKPSTAHRSGVQQPIHATHGGVDRYACLLHTGEDKPALHMSSAWLPTLVPCVQTPAMLHYPQ